MRKKYQHLYNIGDVLLLIGVVVNLKKNKYGKYDLDSLNFITLPLFSWKCALKITGIELEY